MLVDGLEIPELLLSLVSAGVWPRDQDEFLRQEWRNRTTSDLNRRMRSICLFPPPFSTLARLGGDGMRFYAEYGAPHELVLEAAVEIADFGVGSDTPILLDFRHGSSKPSVIQLDWPSNGPPNRWIELSPTFEEFADLIGLRVPGAR